MSGFTPSRGCRTGCRCAYETRHDFVGDQQHAVAVADFAHERPVVRGRHDHAARTLNRLGDERGDRVGALEQDLALEQLRADAAERFGILRKRIAIEPRRLDVKAAGQVRLVVAPEHRVAVHRRAAEMRAVVALLQRNEFRAVGLPAHLPVLARDLQRGLDRVRSARAVQHAAHALGLHHVDQLTRQFLGARVRDAVEQLEVFELVELAHDRFLDLGAVVADVDVPEARDAVDELATALVVHVAAVAAHDADRLAALHVVRVQHRVPETGIVVAHCIAPGKNRTVRAFSARCRRIWFR